MGNDHRQLLDFLAGSLETSARDAFDAHLLACDRCWSAVCEDRRGREAAETLREIAPAALRERIRLAIEIASQEHSGTEWPSRHRQTSLRLGGLVAILITMVVGLAHVARRVPSDPEAVAAVLRLARTLPPALSTATPREVPRTLVVERQELKVRHVHLDGRDVVMAVSPRHFPMPIRAQPLTAEHDGPWLATRGPLGLACFTHPVPMLLAGRISASRLAQLGTRFSLKEIEAASPASNAAKTSDQPSSAVSPQSTNQLGGIR
jgi:hypothetical protein